MLHRSYKYSEISAKVRQCILSNIVWIFLTVQGCSQDFSYPNHEAPWCVGTSLLIQLSSMKHCCLKVVNLLPAR